jgi:hypothetical protein
VARANAVKNVWLRAAQNGNKKRPKKNFTHRVGTVSESYSGRERLFGTTYGTILTRRPGLRPSCITDLRFLVATLTRRS